MRGDRAAISDADGHTGGDKGIPRALMRNTTITRLPRSIATAFPSATRGRCVHERDRRFESVSLQQRVSELSVPRTGGVHGCRLRGAHCHRILRELGETTRGSEGFNSPTSWLGATRRARAAWRRTHWRRKTDSNSRSHPRRERLWRATPGKHRRLGPEPVSGSAFRAAVSDWQRPEEPFAGAGPMVRIRLPPAARRLRC
jgi:hypothetical protein